MEERPGKCVRELSAGQVWANSRLSSELATGLPMTESQLAHLPLSHHRGPRPRPRAPGPAHTFKLSFLWPEGHGHTSPPRPCCPRGLPQTLGGGARVSQGRGPLFLPGSFTCQCLRSAFLSGGLLESADGCEHCRRGVGWSGAGGI